MASERFDNGNLDIDVDVGVEVVDRSLLAFPHVGERAVVDIPNRAESLVAYTSNDEVKSTRLIHFKRILRSRSHVSCSTPNAIVSPEACSAFRIFRGSYLLHEAHLLDHFR